MSLSVLVTACMGPTLAVKTENKQQPASFSNVKDTANVAQTKWRNFFTDANLIALIGM